MPVEIVCTECGAEAFLTREPLYEGFQKVGETLGCSACGHVFAAESDVPFKEKEAAPTVFTEADRSETVQVFAEDERGCLCRHCAEYVVNPFMQYCSLRKKEVEATDSCAEFTSSEGTSGASPF